MILKNIFAAALTALLFAVPATRAEKLVILHTNDTHSQIDPLADGKGGIARRKVLIDSVRAAEPNVMLVDAGDALQGTLYFSLFGGEVETRLMNALKYDIQILGNHEFDNGMEALGKLYKKVNAEKLSSNYRLDKSTLAGQFKPYTVRKVGDKKVGFLAINLIPQGMIADKNSQGVEYLDGVEAANAYGWILKNMEGCDMVVAVTHIGYTDEPGVSDVDLARGSKYIDVIIGGHSHTRINPADPKSVAWLVPNKDGKEVLIAQTGKSGAYLGKVVLDLDSLTASSSLIPVNARLDSRIDPEFAAMIAPYREKVDSVMNIRIGYANAEFSKNDQGLLNLVSDLVLKIGTDLTGRKPDLAIMNKGGLRTDLQKGSVTKGEIMQIMPFDNTVVVLEIKGSDLLKGLEVMARRGGDGVSKNIKVTYSPADGKILSATINGKKIKPDATYTLATINYLADGGDYMTPFKNGRRVAESTNVVYDDVINEFLSGSLKGKKLTPDNTARMTPAK